MPLSFLFGIVRSGDIVSRNAHPILIVIRRVYISPWDFVPVGYLLGSSFFWVSIFLQHDLNCVIYTHIFDHGPEMPSLLSWFSTIKVCKPAGSRLNSVVTSNNMNHWIVMVQVLDGPMPVHFW